MVRRYFLVISAHVPFLAAIYLSEIGKVHHEHEPQSSQAMVLGAYVNNSVFHCAHDKSLGTVFSWSARDGGGRQE